MLSAIFPHRIIYDWFGHSCESVFGSQGMSGIGHLLDLMLLLIFRPAYAVLLYLPLKLRIVWCLQDLVGVISLLLIARI